MNEIPSVEEMNSLDHRIAEAEKLQEIARMHPDQQRAALEEAQKRLATLQQNKIKLQEQIIKDEMKKGKERQAAEEAADKSLMKVFDEIEHEIDEIEKSMKKKSKSNTPEQKEHSPKSKTEFHERT